MMGVMLGSIIFGDLSDRLGRRPVFFVSLVLQVIFGIAMAIAPAMWAFAFFRLVVGATTSGVFLVAYVLALEMVGGKWRTFAGVAVQMFFSMGFLIVAGFAYLIDNWRWLQIALTLPGLAFLCYWWFIPESVRWLLTKGRYKEAREILAKAAEENGKELDKLLVDDLVAQTEADSKTVKDDGQGKPSILDLFRFPNLRKKTFIIFFLWFVNSGAYYGLSWNTSDLGGNDYITFIISGLVELPAYIFIIIFLNHWGRKVILNGSMIAGGICLLATIAVQDVTWARIALAMGGKMAITASYGTVYIFSAEQFPTVIRNVAIGASSTVARLGGILAPGINWTTNIWKPLPLVVYGALALSGGLAALVLPETLNRSLPDTIAEGENFGKTMKEVLSDAEMKTNKDDKEALSS